MTQMQYTPTQYQSQLDEKVAIFKEDFAEFHLQEIDIYNSPETNFRSRAEFRIWHKGPISTYCMFSNDEFKRPYDLTEFPIGSTLMNTLMQSLMVEINADETVRTKLFQVDFLTTRSGEALISLIYHRKLDESWLIAAKHIEQKLGIHLIGRSRGQKIVVSRDHVIEQMHVGDETYFYQQIESGFTQPNGFVCEKMLNWAIIKSQNWGGDLIELYCGNGNFTMPLSRNFNRVLATELAKPSVHSALFNMALNNINNISIARLSSEDFSQAIDKVRSFNRLNGIDLETYRFTSIFVDPPRSGMDPHTTAITQKYENIMYISCNPVTLRENLRSIVQTHDITNIAVFDQFPYTYHLEVGVTLKKKPA